MTERGALLGVPVDPPLHRVDIDERQLTGARSSGTMRASSARKSRPAASSWRTLPQVNERRNEPSVDGARTPPNRPVIAP